MRSLFNDNDPHACQWLRNLIEAGELEGDVLEKPIQEVRAEDVAGHERVHFFAGIGGWELALRLAGWDGPVWTASLPCQPFSAAGKRKGVDDERHLWPAFLRLVRLCRPATLLGEQVASSDGIEWLARVQADMEQEGYAVGRAALCAAGVGAPHIRRRLFWVADAGSRTGERNARGLSSPQARVGGARQQHGGEPDGPEHGRAASGLGDADRDGQRTGGQPERQPRDAAPDGRLDDSGGERAGRENTGPAEPGGDGPEDRVPRPAGRWDNFALVPCRDDKVRRVESGLQPMVDGLSFRLADGRTREGVSRAKVLRGIGNAIVPEVAAVFVRAFMDATTPDWEGKR